MCLSSILLWISFVIGRERPKLRFSRQRPKLRFSRPRARALPFNPQYPSNLAPRSDIALKGPRQSFVNLLRSIDYIRCVRRHDGQSAVRRYTAYKLAHFISSFHYLRLAAMTARCESSFSGLRDISSKTNSVSKPVLSRRDFKKSISYARSEKFSERRL